MALLLGGGGDAQDERPVLDRFVELSGSGPIAYWPVALDLCDYSAATAFVEDALGRPVHTWARLDVYSAEDLRSCGGVFIGGGNTYHLLNEVRRCSMIEALRSFATAGALYGGSAGAILFGADIGPAGYFDQNEVGITDTSGIGLLGDYTVWCHFEVQQTDRLNDWVQSAPRDHPHGAVRSRGDRGRPVFDREGAPVHRRVGREHPGDRTGADPHPHLNEAVHPHSEPTAGSEAIGTSGSGTARPQLDHAGGASLQA